MHLHLRLKPRGPLVPVSTELPDVEEQRGLVDPTDMNRDQGFEFSQESGPAYVKAVSAEVNACELLFDEAKAFLFCIFAPGLPIAHFYSILHHLDVRALQETHLWGV